MPRKWWTRRLEQHAEAVAHNPSTQSKNGNPYRIAASLFELLKRYCLLRIFESSLRISW
jgi:hypothetical protein